MDDLLDLDFAAKPTSLSSASSNNGRSTPNPPYGRSTFDYLSSASAGSTLRPSPSLSPNVSRPTSPAIPSRQPAIPTKQSSLSSKAGGGGGGDDAFSSLFGASPSSASSGAGLSMAERLAKENAARSPMGSLGTGGGSWTTLSPNVTGGSSSRAASPALRSHTPTRGASMNSLSNSSSQSQAAPADPWDLDFLASTSKPAPAPPTSISSPDPFDLTFDSLPPKPSPTPSKPTPKPKASAPKSFLDDDAFDRNNQEGLLGTSFNGGGDGWGSDGDDDGDILGALSKPVSSVPLPTSRATPISRSNTSSPPPHVLGQIAEMGFSIQQAKIALVATKGSGAEEWRVEAALEALVEQSQVEDSQSRRNEEDRRSRETIERELGPVEQPTPRPTGRRAREAAAKAAAEEAAASASKQAQDLLAQASKIGFSMFKSANSYIQTGRATLQKAIDEKMTDGAGSSSGAGGDGKSRPKWMTEDFVDDEEEVARPMESRGHSKPKMREKEKEERREPTPPLFQDLDDEDPVLPQRPVPTASTARLAPQSTPVTPSPSNGGGNGYQSPWRRAGKSTSNTPEPSSRSTTPQPPTPRPPPSPKPVRPPRPSIPVSPAQLSQSSSHKLKGNEFFKLGQFGDAEGSYTRAIQSLPDGSLLLIPLYNNRANTRLKVGNEKEATEDCTKVIAIILQNPNGVIVGGRVDMGALEEDMPAEAKEINLKDHLAKALGRRAKANEVNERWAKALEDWSCLMNGGKVFSKSAGGSKLVSEGVSRCRKMVAGENGPPTSTARPPPPRPKATPRPKAAATVVPSGEAVKALRNASELQNAEDDLRLSLKDAVDAKLTAWKGGKEANLRALIASLENVLWKELEWKKIGMHELISENQLKIRYMKAIAKVHPDKLAAGQTTVEQRMIAGGVFSALNDAWNATRT